MNKILCPTRGGEASQINQDKAIEIAAERGWKIVFLYVSNVGFLRNLRTAMMEKQILNDLDDMGEFILSMAQERAEKKNVESEICLKHGVFFTALKEAAEEYETGAVFLGSSAEDEGYTTKGYLDNLVEHVCEFADLEIIIARKGKIVKHVQKTNP
jgi:hypothetical protein